MTKNQINRKEMQEATATFLDMNAEVWNAIPKVVAFKNELDALNTKIEEAQESQLKARVFVGKTKSQLKKIISQKSDMVNNILEAYAEVEGDAELASRMGDSASDLYIMRNEDFIPKIREIVTEGQNRTEVLTEYGLSEELLTDLMADVDNFLVMNGKPRLYRIASSQATSDLEELFASANELLENKLDKVMTIFKTRNRNFYNGYLAARTVVDV